MFSRFSDVIHCSKFASTHFDKIADQDKSLPLHKIKQKITRDFDKYLLNKLFNLVEFVDQAFLNYEYASAMSAVETFFWSLFCNNYLEITKSRAYNQKSNDKEGRLASEFVC